MPPVCIGAVHTHKRGIESIWNVSGSDWDEAALSLTFSDDPRAKAMSFMRNYGEPYVLGR